MTQFVAALDGMNSACRELQAPIISGNVSFYNETKSKNISPTPSTGLVGLRSKIENLPTSTFTSEGEDVYTLTWGECWTDGLLAEMKSQTAKAYLNFETQGFDGFVKGLTKLGTSDLVSSARVVSKFGLLYALTRMSLQGMGAQIESTQNRFVEPLYQIVVSTKNAAALEKAVQSWNLKPLKLQKIGQTKKNELVWGDLKIKSEVLNQLYKKSWEAQFENLA